MKLFISLYLDQDVSVHVAALLRSRHFEAMTTKKPTGLAAVMRDNYLLPYKIRWQSLRTTAKILRNYSVNIHRPAKITTESSSPGKDFRMKSSGDCLKY